MKSFLVEFGRVLMRFALDKAVREALPRIYKRLDMEMPTLLMNATSERIQKEIALTISKETRRPVKPSQIEAVIGLYSPVAGAVKAFRK